MLRVEREDWSWLDHWAGGEDSLLDLLDDDTTQPIRGSVLDTLDLLADIRLILPRILDHPNALSFLLSLPSYPSQPLLQRLYADPTYALHPNLRNHLPHSHPLKKLVQGGRTSAWANLELGRGALMLLTESSLVQDFLEIPTAKHRTNLAALLDHAQTWAEQQSDEAKKCLELALDLLESPSLYSDPIIAAYLARVLPKLVMISRTRGSQRILAIPNTYARQVLKTLVEGSTEMIDGIMMWPAACALAQPYLTNLEPNEPFVPLFNTGKCDHPDQSSLPDTVDGRRLSRLSRAIDALFPIQAGSSALATKSSIHHQATPTELISLIAPQLLYTLSTAPIPPLGIPSILNPTPESQASAWAGKVYSSHEFRDRERDRERENVGLGIGAGLGRGARQGLGQEASSSAVGGARPASRHVDEYA